jgi:hypothetical protein
MKISFAIRYRYYMKNINLIQLKRELSQLEKCITKYSETSESAMGSIFDVSTQSDLIKVQFKNFESLNVKLSQKYNESTEFSLIELIKNAQIKAYTNTSKMSMNLTLNADVINLNRYKGAIRVLDFIFTIFIEICIHGGVKNCNLCNFDNSYSSNLTFILS